MESNVHEKVKLSASIYRVYRMDLPGDEYEINHFTLIAERAFLHAPNLSLDVRAWLLSVKKRIVLLEGTHLVVFGEGYAPFFLDTIPDEMYESNKNIKREPE